MKIWQKTSLNVLGVGGVEKHIHCVSKALQQLGHEVHISKGLPPFEPEIIHTHGDSWIGPSLIRARFGGKKPLWIHVFHGTSVGRMVACHEFLSLSAWRGSLRDFLPTIFFDAAIAVGANAAAEAERYFHLRKPLITISNGADPAVFKPLTHIADLKHIAFIGRAEDRVKNVDTLVKAGEALASKFSDFRLLAAPGIPHPRSFIQNLGPQKDYQLATLLQKVRALVLCSFYEGDSIVLREARSLGLPIVASNIKPIRDSLAGYKNSFYFDPKEPLALVDQLEKVIASKEITPSPSSRSWQIVASEFESFYRRTV